MYSRIFARTSITPVEALDYDKGLTLSQIEVLIQEINYQDNISLAQQIQSQAMALPTLAQIIGAMMGGGGDISDSLKAMTDMAMKLMEYEGKSSVEDEATKKVYDNLLAHPMFDVHRNSDMAQFAKDTRGIMNG